MGLPTANLADLLSASGPGLTLPLDVLVSTPSGILGSDCTLGDATTPMTLNLTTGTTDPPGPNTPITGAIGTFTSTNDGILTDTGMTLVDNAFAVPGARELWDRRRSGRSARSRQEPALGSGIEHGHPAWERPTRPRPSW